MQGAGGIGADKFHLNPLAVSDVGSAKGGILPIDAFQDWKPRFRGQVEIQKPGSGDFRPQKDVFRIVDVFHDDFCDLAGGHFLDRGHGHGQVGGKIAVGLELGLFHLHIRKIRRRKGSCLMGPAGRRQDHLFDFLFHSS